MSQFVSGTRLTPELPGHGKVTYGRYDFGSLWEYVESQQSPAQWEKTTLVLHSMSAALLPELVTSKTRPAALVLIEGNLVGDDAKWSRQISTQPEDVFEDWLTRMRGSAAMVLRSQLKTRHEFVDLVRWAEGFKLVNAEALREIANNLVERSESGANLRAIERLDLPTRYLRGALSEPWDEGRGLLTNIHVPVIDIPNAGHYPMIDNPRATWEAISFRN